MGSAGGDGGSGGGTLTPPLDACLLQRGHAGEQEDAADSREEQAAPGQAAVNECARWRACHDWYCRVCAWWGCARLEFGREVWGPGDGGGASRVSGRGMGREETLLFPLILTSCAPACQHALLNGVQGADRGGLAPLVPARRRVDFAAFVSPVAARGCAGAVTLGGWVCRRCHSSPLTASPRTHRPRLCLPPGACSGVAALQQVGRCNRTVKR